MFENTTFHTFFPTVVWVLAFKAGFYDLYEMLPGFFAGFVATIGVSLLTEPPAAAAEELEAMRAAVGHPFKRFR